MIIKGYVDTIDNIMNQIILVSVEEDMFVIQMASKDMLEGVARGTSLLLKCETLSGCKGVTLLCTDSLMYDTDQDILNFFKKHSTD